MPDQEWYRTWRHEEREFDQRLAVSPKLRRNEAVKRIVGSAAVVGAMVFIFLSIRDVVGW